MLRAKPSYTLNPPTGTTRALLGNPEPLGEINIPDGICLPGLDTAGTYAVQLIGRALEPIASSGEHAICSPLGPVEPGDFVAIIPMDKRNAILVRRLVMPSPVPFGQPHPASNVQGTVLVELVAERQIQQFATGDIAAMHLVLGFLKRDGSMAAMPVPSRVRRAV